MIEIIRGKIVPIDCHNCFYVVGQKTIVIVEKLKGFNACLYIGSESSLFEKNQQNRKFLRGENLSCPMEPRAKEQKNN